MKGSEFLEVQSGLSDSVAFHNVAASLADPSNAEMIRNLGLLVPQDLSKEARMESCIAQVVYLLSNIDPQEDDRPDAPHQVSTRFIKRCSPLGMYRWTAHIAVRLSRGKVEAAHVSTYLCSVLCRAEDLWGVQGLFINGRE
jgi:hypothetical protein